MLYGENEFQFWDQRGFLDVLWRLPKEAYWWLKKLTMSVPIVSGYWYFHPKGLNDPRWAPLDRTVANHVTGADNYLGNSMIRDLLDALADAPCFRWLKLVIAPHWVPTIERTDGRTRVVMMYK